jgi:hypothetical protein
MSFYQVDKEKNQMREMWGSTKSTIEYEKEDSKKVLQEIMHDSGKKHNLKKQTELHEKIRNDDDYDDWSYGTEPSYGKIV